jgi:DNA invertase Pin-like site-specific DNA recombinase
MKVGYARVSTVGQNLEAQIEILKEYGCEKIFIDRKTGANTNREQLKNAMNFVREGDTLCVTRIDRFGRNSRDLYNLIGQLEDKGVAFYAIQQNLTTEGQIGKLMFGLLATIAEFELSLRAERQREGIDNALKRGIAFGRKPKVTPKQIEEMYHLQKEKDNKLTNQQIADRYGISRSSFLRLMAKYKREHDIIK